jgi:hypothetical protein
MRSDIPENSIVCFSYFRGYPYTRGILNGDWGTAISMKEKEKWNPKTGYYNDQFMATGIPTLEERMNSLARQQTKERKELRERDAENNRKFVLAERRVVGCSHDWQPVHKWLHKEYMHCLKCGAVKHKDGTVWFFVDHQSIKLTIKKS